MDRGEMNDTEEEARYPSNHPYNEQDGDEFEEEEYEEDVEEEDGDEDEEEVEEEEDEEENVVQQRVKEEVEEVDEPEQQLEQDHASGDGDYEDEDDTDDNDDNVDGGGNDNGRNEEEDSERNGKKQKLKDLSVGYEFAPRVVAPQPSAVAIAVPKSSYGGRKNAAADWTEHATFILLDTWGDKFLQLGRKSLRLDEWIEVAKKVSRASNVVRTDTQCRNRLDTLKKKYKKEKVKLEETGNNNNISCKWVYFKKMDMLMNVSPRQPGVTCGLDSREYVFTNPRVYLNHSNGLDEMRDSPGYSESTEADDDNSDGLPPKKARYEENGVKRSSFRLLADSIKKFGDIHAKIENSKRQHMLELEKMRMEFHRDLELHRRKILERAREEIAKMRDEDEEDAVSIKNMSD